MHHRNPTRVTVSRNPGLGRPWAVCLAGPNTFTWRLFDSYDDAIAAARAISIAELEGDKDFSVAIARIPYDVPLVSAIEAGIEVADALLATVLAGKVR